MPELEPETILSSLGANPMQFIDDVWPVKLYNMIKCEKEFLVFFIFLIYHYVVLTIIANVTDEKQHIV